MAKVRIKVNLDERQYALAKKEAQALGISFAEYVRRAIQQTLSAQDDPPWMRYAGPVQSGNPHSTRSVDEVVYGNRPVNKLGTVPAPAAAAADFKGIRQARVDCPRIYSQLPEPEQPYPIGACDDSQVVSLPESSFGASSSE